MEWQRDFLSHVRSVHFTVLGVSLALLVASALLPSASIEEAYRQLQTITRIVTADLTWDAVAARARERRVHLLVTDDEYEITPEARVFAEQVADDLQWVDQSEVEALGGDIAASPSLVMIGSIDWRPLPHREDARLRHHLFFAETDSGAANTLETFSRTWNFLDTARAYRIDTAKLPETELFAKGQRIGQCHGGVVGTAYFCRAGINSHLPGGSRLVAASFGLSVPTSGGALMAPRDWSILVDFEPDDFWLDAARIPVEMSYLDEVDAQQFVLSPGEPRTASGPAETVFGDLYDVARGLETLSFDQLAPYMRRLRDERSDQVTLLGVDIPLSLAGRWGLVVLLSTQVYFLLHFARLRRLGIAPETLERYPWIMLYRDPGSRLASLISVVAIPAITAVALTRPALAEDGSQRWLLLLLGAASLVVTALTLAVMASWWRRRPAEG